MPLRPPGRRFASLAFFILALVPLSCGDPRFKPVYPVKGQVTFDGKPAAGAAVTLHPQNVPEHPWTKPSGEVNENGEFTISTYKSGDGAPAGSYAVTIVWIPPNFAGPTEKGNKLPARYANKDTSGLTVEILTHDNELPAFNLTK